MIEKLIARSMLYRGTPIRTLLRGTYWLLHTRLLGVPCLKYLDVAIDYACNARCQHCFASRLKRDDAQRLSLEDCYRISKAARSVGCLHVNLQGGEPLLLDNLSDYVRAFCPGQCHISITTNAWLFSKEKAAMLRRVGVRQCVFSLDSLKTTRLGDTSGERLPPERVLEAIHIAKQVGLGVSVNVVVRRNSLQTEEQDSLFSWLQEQQIPYNPILACAVGGWEERDDVMVTSKEAAYVNALRDKNALAQRDLHASWVAQGCGAVAEQLYITPYGDVMPCPFIHISLGNIHEADIGAIWKNWVAQGLHGHYAGTCWVAENQAFAKDLSHLCSKYPVLPIPHSEEAGLQLLSHWWKGKGPREPGTRKQL